MSVISGSFDFQQTAILNNGLDNYYVRTTVASGSYSVVPSDTIIAVTGTTGATITLPSVTSHVKFHKKILVITDEGGNATASPITITPAAGEEIDNTAGSYSLDWDRGALIMYAEPDGPGWKLMSKPEPASSTGYTPIRPDDWEDTDPTNAQQALDRLAYNSFIAHGVVLELPP